MGRTPLEPLSDAVDRYWNVIAGPGVWAAFGALTVPFVAGILDTRLMSPLAAPGYVLFVGLSIVGERIVPQYAFWLYWGPFLACCYVLSVVISTVVRKGRSGLA